tara:strand:+ start:229 stop:504 length:276 start_codon:yes stop_codon:yes gene_type:complete
MNTTNNSEFTPATHKKNDLSSVLKKTNDLFTEVDKRQKKNPTEDSLTNFIKTAEENPNTVSHIPDAKEQFEAIKQFQTGGLSYAEMRMRCG